MPTRVYLDWNATTPLRPEARAAILAAQDLIGNPSSVHAEGREARRLIEEARATLAAAVGAQPREAGRGPRQPQTSPYPAEMISSVGEGSNKTNF